MSVCVSFLRHDASPANRNSSMISIGDDSQGVRLTHVRPSYWVSAHGAASASSTAFSGILAANAREAGQGEAHRGIVMILARKHEKKPAKDGNYVLDEGNVGGGD